MVRFSTPTTTTKNNQIAMFITFPIGKLDIMSNCIKYSLIWTHITNTNGIWFIDFIFCSTNKIAVWLFLADKKKLIEKPIFHRKRLVFLLQQIQTINGRKTKQKILKQSTNLHVKKTWTINDYYQTARK